MFYLSKPVDKSYKILLLKLKQSRYTKKCIRYKQKYQSKKQNKKGEKKWLIPNL